MGEFVLFEIGYYLGDLGVDFRKLNLEKEWGKINIIRLIFGKNDWKGEWFGKNGIYLFNDFFIKFEL